MKKTVILLCLVFISSCSGGWGAVEEVSQNYVQENGKTYRLVDGHKVEVSRNFYDDFEGEQIESIHDIIAQGMSDIYEKHWQTMTLQSPLVPEVSDYVTLRKCILDKTCDFKENFISIDDNFSYNGRKSLKFHAVEKSESMVTSKSSIQNGLLYYKKGDNIWMSAMIYIEGSIPYSLIDLETSFMKESPGIRVIINPDHLVRTELKYKPKWKSKRASSKPEVPIGKWFHLKIHYYLDETEKGFVQIWQDNVKIVEDYGPTLPTIDTIYDKLEIGISAHSFSGNSAVFFDTVSVADTEEGLILPSK